MPDRPIDAAHVHARFLAGEQNTPESFVKEFGKRAPDAKTIRKFLGDPGSISLAKLRMINDCLLVPQLQFQSYHILAQGLNITEVGKARAQQLMGLYRYHRPGTNGKKASGGLYLFETGGLFRFFHFRNSEKFNTFVGLLKSDKTDKRIAPFRLAGDIKPSPDHRGYYFCQDDRFYLIGINSSYFRTVMGHRVDDLSTKYLRVLVMAYGYDKRTFSAKSFLVHESNARFDHEFSDEDICRVLEINSLSEGVLHALSEA